VLKNEPVSRIWINDLDTGICAIWNSVIWRKDELIESVKSYQPCVDDFFRFKSNLVDREYLSKTDIVNIALSKLAAHQMSFSGLGTMAGSPIGGKSQVDAQGEPKKYKIDCRWSVSTLCKNIEKSHKILTSRKIFWSGCTDFDYRKVLLTCTDDMFMYLDPPYYEMGGQLYQCAFSEEQHIDLCDILRNRSNWLLSYDNHPRIRELYDWAVIEDVSIKYTINNNIEQCKELLIYPKGV
jgi:DNA adenine methylase